MSIYIAYRRKKRL